jgi:cardiolipin synthase
MPYHSNNIYTLFDEALEFYNALLEDIKNASKSVYIEIFKFRNGYIANRILSELTRAVKRGIDVRILVDDWGTPNAKTLFSEFTNAGGSALVWEKIKFSLKQRSIIKTHKRNHRKIITIDNQITYIGSANITDYNLPWKESMLRVANYDFAKMMKRIFLQYYNAAKQEIEKKGVSKTLHAFDFEVLRDVPSITWSTVRKRYIELIENATESVTIVTPYFFPSQYLRKPIEAAVKKGIEINVIIPLHSDVPSADILRRRYLGALHEKGVNIFHYTPGNLHAKMVFVDETVFSIGSSNFDYRSFRFQHEIVVLGRQPEIVDLVKKHISGTLKDCIPFDYESWKRRSNIEIFTEWLLLPFRHLF